MKNVKVDFTTNSIIVTAAFMKRASRPESKEFNEFIALRNKLPKYSVTVIPAKKRAKKSSTTEGTVVEEQVS